MGVPVYFYSWVDSQADAGKLTAARLNGDFAPLYACLDPATGGLEDTNVKAGAKIVCTDRAHTVTGVWTFTTAPVLPAASIPNAALQSTVMLKTTYDADLDGRVSLAVDSDTVDGSHAAAFAVASYITSGTLDGDRLPALSTTKKGGVPATGTPSGKYLKDDNTWAAPLIYALAITSLNHAAPNDITTYYVGNQAAVPDTTAQLRRVYIPKSGTIKVAYITYIALTAGTNESFSIYIRLNNTTDYLIKAVAENGTCRLFDNAALSIAVVAGDFIEIKVVGADWATTPANVLISGSIYIE